MRIIIVGAGKVGLALTQHLSGENQVTVIDQNPQLIDNIINIHDVMGVCGNGASYEVQKEAEADKAELLIATTSSDETNIVACLVAKKLGVQHTIARIRTDYVHEQQSRYRTAIADLEQRINGASTSERVKLSKQLAKLQAQAEEVRVYEEKIHHLADQMIKIDLDDGVKHNYELFRDVLAKIK